MKNNEITINKVESELNEMGLDHLQVDLIMNGGEDENTPCIKVTYGEGIFGYRMEKLNNYFNLDLFLMFFRGRNNYLKLTEDERSKITMHPQMWEKEFLAGNTSK